MVDTIKAAFGSKKFLATVIGAVVVAAGSAMGLSEEQSMKIAAMIVAYVVGQGVADHGKEKTKLESELNGKGAAEKAAALESAL